jgi:hypothetical protein
MLCTCPSSIEAIETADFALGGTLNGVMRFRRRQQQDFRLEQGVYLMTLDARGYQMSLFTRSRESHVSRRSPCEYQYIARQKSGEQEFQGQTINTEETLIAVTI